MHRLFKLHTLQHYASRYLCGSQVLYSCDFVRCTKQDKLQSPNQVLLREPGVAKAGELLIPGN